MQMFYVGIHYIGCFYRGGCELLLEKYTETKENAEVFSRLNHFRGY